MAAIGVEEIPRLLSNRGWNVRAIDKNTWRCRIPTAADDARLILRHAGAWLYLAVMPFLDPASIKPWGNGKFPPRFLGRILAVNSNLTLVKFALDEDGDLALRVELPTESLQLREFETALNLMIATTEQYRIPIRDALLDAGRASERPSSLPEVMTLSESPPASEEEPLPDEPIASGEQLGAVGASLDRPPEESPGLADLARDRPSPSDPPPAS